MDGISIRYKYDGDEATWRAAIDAFIDAVDDDPDVGGKFSYAVSVAGDGVTRSHTGRWDTEATLKTLQSRDYFKTFAEILKGLASGSLDAVQIALYRETR
ncbi:MAG: hypothetical protein ACTSX7_11010 [Alphaproteobacteria bacterium]